MEKESRALIKQQNHEGICYLDLDKENLKQDRPHFTVSTYLDYIDEKK